MTHESAPQHPVLSACIDDVDHPLVLIGRWLSNRHGEQIATREYPLESERVLEKMLVAAGTINGPSADFLRAFVAYRQELVCAQRRFRTTPAWIDGSPYRLVDTREAQGRLLVSESEWERAPGEAALFLAEWAPDGQCPIEATDLWNSGLPRSLWTQWRFDPEEAVPDLVDRALVRTGDPDHPFRPDLAVVAAGKCASSHHHGSILLMRACGDDWVDARCVESPAFNQAVYWIVNHCGDVRREPFPPETYPLEQAPAGIQTAVQEALTQRSALTRSHRSA